MQTILNYSNEDFVVFKNGDEYLLSIEGLIGYEEIDSFIPFYSDFANTLLKFITSEGKFQYEDKNDMSELVKRSAEIKFWQDHYWVFIEPLRAKSLWDIYYYVLEIIELLKIAQ